VTKPFFVVISCGNLFKSHNMLRRKHPQPYLFNSSGDSLSRMHCSWYLNCGYPMSCRQNIKTAELMCYAIKLLVSRKGRWR